MARRLLTIATILLIVGLVVTFVATPYVRAASLVVRAANLGGRAEARWHGWKGRLLQAMGRPDEARAALEEAVAARRALGPDTVAIAPVQQEILRLVNEALVNAARHAQASLVTVDLAVHDGHVRVEVTDNGHGFPFTGKFDLAALNEMGIGPHSLKERVGLLGGQLLLESSVQGVRLVIIVPLDRSRQAPPPAPPPADAGQSKMPD